MLNLSATPLTYDENLSVKYRQLSQLPGFALLQSSDQKKGRYDIVSAYPYDEFILNRNVSIPEDIFKQLERFVPKISSTSDFPFQGGAIGYISYDLVMERMALSKPLPHDLSEMPLIDLKLYDWAIIVDHMARKAFLVSANLNDETRLLIPDIVHLWNTPLPEKLDFNFIKPFDALVTSSHYQESFDEIYEHLMWGRAYQVNYTIPFEARFEGSSWCFYERLCQINPVPFGGFLRSKDIDIISFSPERFLKIDNNQILTSPIKGTAPRSNDSHTDNLLQKALLESEKNKAENVMIVDLMRNDLAKVSLTGSVHVKKLFELQSFQAVHHLVSHIVSEMKPDLGWGDVFEACFPGGSITGAPKIEAIKIIHEQEDMGRGVYCGSLGYFSHHGRVDTNIAIRTMMAHEGYMYLQAGGGVTVSSVSHDELEECYTKVKAIVEKLTDD